MALTPMQKVIIIAGFLFTGSINTLTKKWQFQTCGPTHYPLVIDSKDCAHLGWKPFHKPWTQNLQMFTGEAFVFLLFLARRSRRAKEARDIGEEVSKAPFYIFFIPACCDIFGTGIGGVGMLFISAPVWQMMRGSLMIFAALWSAAFLRKRQPVYSWLAVGISTIGLFLIGCSAIMDSGSTGSSSNVPLGILLTVISQAFAAAQMVLEEVFVKGYNAPPEQVVGSEGVWGVILMIIVLFVMYWIPGNDGGSYENAVDSMEMLFSSAKLVVFVLLYLFSISFFNFFGVTIAGELSAVHRTINDALRTIIIWGVQIFVFYVISEDYGTPWTEHTYMQLIGFGLLVLGNLVKNAIIKIPGFAYEEEAQKNPMSTSNTGVSLVLVDEHASPRHM